MKKVLIIEECQQFRSVLRSALASKYEVLETEGVRDALGLAIHSGPDLVIVDESLAEICERLRVHPATRGIPIIMVADSLDHGEWAARVRCLDRGADDALHRAFYPEELLAKVRARLRERERDEREQQALTAGNLVLDPGGASVRIENRPVVLTPTEFELLRYFLERTGRVIPRKQLLGELWAETVVTRRTIDTHIANLRRKLRGFNHSFETIYGAGYRLCVAEVCL